MKKIHINSKGVPSMCRAVKGNCPFSDVDEGGVDRGHFDNYEEAQDKADELMSAEYGLLYQEEKVIVKEDGAEFSDPTLEDETLKIAAQTRIDLEDMTMDYERDAVSIAGNVVSDYTSYLRKTENDNPASLYEFFEKNGSNLDDDKPDKESFAEVQYDYHDGPVGERWTQSSQDMYDEASGKHEDIEDNVSMTIENLDDYSKRVNRINWEEKGVDRKEAMIEFYDYMAHIYDNHD